MSHSRTGPGTGDLHYAPGVHRAAATSREPMRRRTPAATTEPRPTALPALDPTLAAAVRTLTGVSWSRARELCASGRVTVDGVRCGDPAARVPAAAVVAVDASAPRRRSGELAAEAILYADAEVVVVDKPAGMLTVPAEPGDHGALADHVRTLLRATGHGDTALGVVQRLDRETSGVMLFTRTAHAKRALAARFREHDMDRTYHAIAHGAVGAGRVETLLIPDRGDGLRGSYGHFRRAKGPPPADARRSVTHVAPLLALVGATCVECRLETGRQHQIRIHLSELGHPVVGERVYIRDFTGARIDAPRTMLHARTLGFVHPRTGRALTFEAEPPADFQALLAGLALDSRRP